MFRRFILSLFCVSLFASAVPAHAAELTAGDLIKSPAFPDVYYYGADGKRYVFPNEKIFFSWYDAFAVTTVTGDELAAVPFGNVVHYRPGVRMVKVTTDPKVYAVSRGGVLRWIASEAIAAEMYGTDWATNVHDLPDAFFASYTVGDPIESASAYAPDAARDGTPTIDHDLGLVTEEPVPPPPPEEGTIGMTFSASKTSVRPGDVITVIATASHPDGIRDIQIFFDGIHSKTCAAANCGDEVVIPLSGTKETYLVRAVATAIDNSTQEKEILLSVDNSASPFVRMTLTQSHVRPNQLAEIIIDTDVSIAILRTDIYVGGISVEACASAIRQCRWTDRFDVATGTAYVVYGLVTDTNGQTYKTREAILTIADNDSPIVSLLVGKDAMYVGESVDMTADATDADGIESVEILKDGAIIHTCQTSPCTFVLGPAENTGTITLHARATDALGLSEMTDAVSVTVSAAP